MPATDPDCPDFSIDGFSPRFSRVIALLSGAAARIIEISALDPPDPRGDAPIGLDLAVVSGISVPNGLPTRERPSLGTAGKERAA